MGKWQYTVNADKTVKATYVPDPPIEVELSPQVGYVFIDKIEPNVHLRAPLSDEDVPTTIKVLIPNQKLPEDELEFQGELTNDVVKYVRYDNMPAELQNVIREYLNLLKDGPSPTFINTAKKLHDKLCATYPQLVGLPDFDASYAAFLKKHEDTLKQAAVLFDQPPPTEKE